MGKPKSTTTTTAGSANAATLTIGAHMTAAFDVYYDVANTDGDIVVEIRKEPAYDAEDWPYQQSAGVGSWLSFDAVDTSVEGRTNVYQAETMFYEVRVYADGNDFTDSDVNDITISTRVDNNG